MRGFGWGRWPALLMGCAWLLAWESVTQAGPLDVGRTAMRDEMFDVAEQQLRKAVQRHEPGSPEYADSLLLLLECLYRSDPKSKVSRSRYFLIWSGRPYGAVPPIPISSFRVSLDISRHGQIRVFDLNSDA